MAGEDQGQGDSRQDRPAPGRTPRSSAERQADFEDLADSGGWTLIGPADETPAQPIVSEPQPTAPVPIPEPPAAPVLQVAPALPEPSVVLPEPVPEVESLAPPAATEFPDPPASAARAPSRAPVPELVVPKRNTFKLPPPLPLSPPPRKRVTLARSAPPPAPAPRAVSPARSAPPPSTPPRAVSPARGVPVPMPGLVPLRARRSRKWGWTALAAAFVLCLGALLWQAREARALERELAQSAGGASLDPAALAELEALRRAAQAADEVARNREELAQKVATLEARLEQDQRALEESARQQNATAERLGAELAALRMLSERDVPSANASLPAALRAEACDRILGLVEAREGARAQALLAERIATGLFLPESGDGSALLVDLTECAAQLQAAGLERSTSASPAAAALLASRAALERAAQGRAEFPAQSASWLGLLSVPADPKPALARLDRVLLSLQADLDSTGAELSALHASDWDWILSGGARQAPDPAQAHSDAFACSHADELAALFAAELAAEFAPLDVLNVEGLESAAHLPAWAQRAAQREPAKRSAADSELLWLDAARRWYLEGEPAADFAWNGLARPALGARGPDWRAELHLRVELAAPDSGWPPKPGRVAVYRLEGNSRARWRADACELEPGANARTGWTWRRAHFDGAGTLLGEPVSVPVERDGERTRLADAEFPLLDLRAHLPVAEVARLEDLGGDQPPPHTGARPTDARALAFEVAAGLDCLVVRQGDTTRWFAPGLGLVLEERGSAGNALRIELAAFGMEP